jgi:hypothetical protein
MMVKKKEEEKRVYLMGIGPIMGIGPRAQK